MTITNTTFKNASFPNTRFYQIEGPLTEEDVKMINTINSSAILIFKNTKDLNPTILRKIHNPNVQISIMGGLDYLHKRKFNARHYIDRTLHSPNELATIIEYFQKIESKIRYTWTDRQKAMFVYQSLCEALHYSKDEEGDYENGRDITRSLSGLLYGRLVCSGFALVFKEAMDRIGIPCIYQNRCSSHSWNIIGLGGKCYGVELTWDCSHKQNNVCSFGNFGLDPNFYQNRHHDLSLEDEEREIPLSHFTVEELREDYKQIAYNKPIEKRAMTPIQDSDGKIFYSSFQKNKDGVYTYIIFLQGQTFLIHTNKDADHLYSLDVYHCIENNGWDPTLPKNLKPSLVTYQREDRSTFFMKKIKDIDDKMKEFAYFDVKVTEKGPIVRRTILLSEMELAAEWGEPIRSTIANRLLSSERLKRKVNYTRGYVGYVGTDRGLYYNREFEKDELHLMEHAL